MTLKKKIQWVFIFAVLIYFTVATVQGEIIANNPHIVYAKTIEEELSGGSFGDSHDFERFDGFVIIRTIMTGSSRTGPRRSFIRKVAHVFEDKMVCRVVNRGRFSALVASAGEEAELNNVELSGKEMPLLELSVDAARQADIIEELGQDPETVCRPIRPSRIILLVPFDVS